MKGMHNPSRAIYGKCMKCVKESKEKLRKKKKLKKHFKKTKKNSKYNKNKMEAVNNNKCSGEILLCTSLQLFR